MSINLLFKSSSQHFIPLAGSSGEEGIKLTLDGDEASSPISMVLS
jgi:hypothetical protein